MSIHIDTPLTDLALSGIRKMFIVERRRSEETKSDVILYLGIEHHIQDGKNFEEYTKDAERFIRETNKLLDIRIRRK